MQFYVVDYGLTFLVGVNGGILRFLKVGDLSFMEAKFFRVFIW